MSFLLGPTPVLLHIATSAILAVLVVLLRGGSSRWGE